MIDLTTLTIEKVHKDLSEGVYSVKDLADAYLANIKVQNERLNIYRHIFDDIEAQVARAQARFDSNTATLLTGIPFAIKDNILRAGHPVGASSKILEGYIAPYSSTVVSLLEEAGAIFLGSTNLDEFAMGSSTESSAYGVTLNPLDEQKVAGGSSGGSAAAVKANMALVALGTETCGSIRLPASFCGIVGMFPTYDTVSRYGVIAMGSSLDQVGPLTKSVRDAEIVLSFLAQHDLKDATSLPTAVRANHQTLSRKKIGVPRAFLNGVSEDVLSNFNAKLEQLKKDGYEIIDIDLPLLMYSLPTYYILMPSEVSSNLARYDGIRYGIRPKDLDLLETYKQSRGFGFGREARRRILLGAYILSQGHYDAYYRKAARVREEIRQELIETFARVDLIATPTTPTVAFAVGEKSKDPVAMYLSDIFAAPGNIANIPSITVPSGVGEESLPTGIQFMADTLNEEILFEVAKKCEQE